MPNDAATNATGITGEREPAHQRTGGSRPRCTLTRRRRVDELEDMGGAVIGICVAPCVFEQ